MVVEGNTLEKQQKRVLTRSIEHQEDSMTGKWEASSATKHSKDSKDFKDCAIIGCPQKRLQNYPAYMNVK